MVGAVVASLITSPLPAQAASPGIVSMIATATCNTGSGYCFAPSVITIPVGGSVTWMNTTSAPHTATDDGGTWTTPTVTTNATLTFSVPGSFSYHCAIHPDMHGTLLVGGTTAANISTQQYTMSASDGTTWQDIDPSHLGLSVTPAANSLAVLSAGADLWTENAGYNQDLGINVNGSIAAWKESGGFAGTFSPNAAFVQTVFPMTGGTTYGIKLQWKANKSAGAAIIAAGAGPWPSVGGGFSPTSLIARLIPISATSVQTAASAQQYQLLNSDGATWQDIDATNLVLTITPPSNSLAIVSGNADLWTTMPGFNQDLGIYLQEASATQYPGNIVAWKESGGFAGTFSPNAAFVQTVLPMTANTTYHLKLRWKTNTNTNSNGEVIVAGAGPWPSSSTAFSPTRLTVQLLPAGTNPATAVSTTQYLLTNSDGNTWQDIDPTNLSLALTPATNCLAVISGNADLWTTQPGYNQDIGIYLEEASAAQYPGNIVAWKESGGFAGTFSPNAAFVQAVFPMSGATAYHLKLRWKTNKNTNNSGETIVAGAGPWPSTTTHFSATRLTVQLVSCS
jgi:plastocyanin